MDYDDDREDTGDAPDSFNGPEQSAEPFTSGSSAWDEEDALENLKMEKTVHGDETNEQMVRRLFDEYAPAAASRIYHIAMHSHNDNTSLNASKFIVEMVTAPDSNPTKAKWEQLVGEFVSETELHANASSGASPADTPDS